MSTLNAPTGIPAPAAPSPRPVSYAAPAARPPRSRFTLRMAVVLALVAVPFAYFAYVIVDQSLNGGVTKHADYYDVDLKSLGYFPFDGVKDDINSVPSRWRELDGKRVALQGEIFNPDTAGENIHSFQLVYSIQKCCFNGPPRVQERVFAKVPNNGAVRYYPQVVRVVGTLHVTAQRNEVGEIVKLYELDVETVDPA